MILETSKKTIEVLKIVVTWPGSTVKEISEEAGVNEGTAKNHLDTLADSGLVRCETVHGAGVYFADREIAALHLGAINALERQAAEIFKRAKEVTNGKGGY